MEDDKDRYMIDHRGLGGRYYSFCKGKVVGDDTYHCRECKTCSGLEHWHSHRFLPSLLPLLLAKSIPFPFLSYFFLYCVANISLLLFFSSSSPPPCSHLKNAVAPCEPTDKKFFYPIPLSGKLMATHSERYE